MLRAELQEQEVPDKDRRYGRHSYGTIWSPHRPTVTYVGSIPIGLTLTEMTERVTLRYISGEYYREDSEQVRSFKPWQLTHTWTTEQDLPSGRFRLIAYSPYPGVKWASSWQETRNRSLGSMIPTIIRTLKLAESELQGLMVAADEAAAKRRREWEESQERWRREEDRRCVAQAQADSKKQLADIMEKWAYATSIER